MVLKRVKNIISFLEGEFVKVEMHRKESEALQNRKSNLC